MAKPITIGGLDFPRKKDAEAHLKSMLGRYNVGDKVSLVDERFLRSAIRRHPEARKKIGCGISSFSVRSADFGTKCFWVNREDGATEKFSYYSCIYG